MFPLSSIRKNLPESFILICCCFLLSNTMFVSAISCPCFNAADLYQLSYSGFCGPDGSKTYVTHATGGTTCTGMNCGGGVPFFDYGCIFNNSDLMTGGISITEDENFECEFLILEYCVSGNHRRNLRQRLSSSIQNDLNDKMISS